jgi:hypothetical protein
MVRASDLPSFYNGNLYIHWDIFGSRIGPFWMGLRHILGCCQPGVSKIAKISIFSSPIYIVICIYTNFLS